MARIKGGRLTVTYDTTKRQPLDSRMLVTKVADLINPVTWVVNGTNVEATFNGMIVVVNNDGDYNGIYYLKDRTAISAENFSNYQAALESSQDTKPYFYMWAKVAELDEVELLSERIAAIETTPEKYEVEHIDGLISTLHGRELRINASNVDFTTANSDAFDINFRAYAPKRGVYFKHSFGKYVQDNTEYTFASDCGGYENGRGYAKMSLPIANKINGIWEYRGDESTEDSFVTTYYSIKWYDINRKLLSVETIEITLANDTMYTSLLSPAMVRYIKEQLKDYCTIDDVRNIVEEETAENAAQPNDIIGIFNR